MQCVNVIQVHYNCSQSNRFIILEYGFYFGRKKDKRGNYVCVHSIAIIRSYFQTGAAALVTVTTHDKTRIQSVLKISSGSTGLFWNTMDIRYWRCIIKKGSHCPDEDIRIYFYSSEHRVKRLIDVTHPFSLHMSGWTPEKKNVIIIHGFNGTEGKTPMTFIRDAYLNREDYNVFTVDWKPLSLFPCYLSSLSNTRLVAQCAAQFYSHLTHSGASAYDTHCVGHSLGAHICGMMSNHLSHRLHKIIGLDPARPLVDRYGDRAFRLTRDDANIVQVIHSNAGFLGETAQVGHVDFCVNGGREQPNCRNEPRRIRVARCSHFMSACYFVATISDRGKRHKAYPCNTACNRRLPGPLGTNLISMGEHTPEGIRGTYCIKMRASRKCPFD